MPSGAEIDRMYRTAAGRLEAGVSRLLPGGFEAGAGTALRHGNRIRAVLESRGGEPTTEGIRRFLANFSDSGSANNYVKSLRVYFRDFLGRGDIVGSFRFATESPNPPRLLTKAEVDAPFHVAETEVMAKTMRSAARELAAKAAIYNMQARM